ncbi:MAG: hypothetical protein GC164_08350 [Phycisphaera sp.]|nr:hypothetical protein [Phycisphaera sp.]
MKNAFVLFIAVVLVLVLGIYMFTYQVYFNQVAVRARFGKATPSSVILEPGLYFKWPWPIDRVEHYDTRLQVLEDNLEQFQTNDAYSVNMRLHMIWKVSDPLAFYSNARTVGAAEKRLKSLMQGLRMVVSKYRFDELVNTDENKLKIAAIEEDARKVIQDQIDQQRYGITIEHVGVRRFVLPESTTTEVFNRMKKDRETRAARIEQAGRSEATRITSEAESMKKRILTAANRRAKEIETQGDLEAAEYYRTFQDGEQFAVFIQRLNALKDILAKNTTFVIDVNQLSEFNLFVTAPPAGTAGNK